MNKKILLVPVILLIFFSVNAFAGPSLPPLQCVEGSTQPCTTTDDCPGTQTCSDGVWRSCIKNDPDCPAECTGSETQSCTNPFGSQNCTGTQTCVNEEWGECIDNSDSCPQCQPIDTTAFCTMPITGCDGTKTCLSSYTWGSCTDTPDDGCPATCTENQHQTCTTSEGCPGIKKCINGNWSPCTDVYYDECPACTALGNPEPCSLVFGTQTCSGTKECPWSGAWRQCYDVADSCPSTPAFTFNWWLPSSSPYRIMNIPTVLAIATYISCANGPCLNTTATLQICNTASCTDYQDISATEGNLRLSTSCYPSVICTPAIQSLGSFSDTQLVYWDYYRIYPADSYNDAYTTNLRVKITSSQGTEYFSGMQMITDRKPKATINNPVNGTEVLKGQTIQINWTTSDLDGDNIKSTLKFDGETIYESSFEAAGTFSENWTIPSSAITGTHTLSAFGYDGLLAGGDSITINIIECTTPGTQLDCDKDGCAGTQTCQADKTWSACIDKPNDGCPLLVSTSAEIISPGDGNYYYIGSDIEFKSNISCGNSPCNIRWDSNKDTGWYSSDENHSYSGLSIGDHTITLNVIDSIGIEDEESVTISIKPITADVLSISNFQITKIEPADRFAVNSKIRIQTRVNYHITQNIDAKAFLIISDPRTGQAIYGPEPFYLSFTVPSFEEYDLNIDLGNYSFEERQNYKVEFLIVSNYVESSPEYFVDPTYSDSAYWADGEPYYIPQTQTPEQNKANNSGYEIIELGPATLGDLTQAPEINPTAILLILFAVLIMLRKK